MKRVLAVFLLLCFLMIYGIAAAGTVKEYDWNTVLLLDQYLPQHPWLVVVGAVSIVIMCVLLPRHLRWSLLILYVAFILYMTLYVREAREDAPVSLELFRSVRAALEKHDSNSSWAQIFNNILLFTPFGFILCSLQSYCSRLKAVKAIVVCLLLSVAIELTQYITGLGWMEIDDVIWNGLGGCIGTGAAWVIHKRKTTNSDGA